ncbi:MAG: endonuclease/exonuclease/phosphatase family protein [Planctomycetota bacterium]|nr:endonuclease/exonuclease/phosphatase family protein [Planctomycetota bacterium]
MKLSNGSSCAAVVAAIGIIVVGGCAKEAVAPVAPRLTFLDPKMTPPPAVKPAVNVAVAAMLPPGNIAPPPAPGTSTASADLRVMSFNCRVSTLFDLHNTWGLRKRLLVDTIQNFRPDLLGTQEVLAPQADFLREQLKGYGFVGVGRDDGKRGGEMCGIFFRSDKFEKLDSGHFWLSQSPSKPGSKGWGALFPRLVTWVKLQPRDGSATFCWFNTHLDAFSSRARLNGAKLLRLRMATIARGMPVLVTGDFNADAGSDPYQELTSTKSPTALSDTFRTVHAAGLEGDGTRHAFRGGRGGPRIDWILASSNGFHTLDADIDHTRSGIMFPSDHFPVTAVLRPTAAPTMARVE